MCKRAALTALALLLVSGVWQGVVLAAEEEGEEKLAAASQPATARSASGLDARVDKLSLALPLSVVLEELGKHSGLRITAAWSRLAGEGVDKERPVGSGQVLGMTVHGCLDIVCRLAGPVAWTQEKDVVILSLRKDLAQRTASEKYPPVGVKPAELAKVLQAMLGLREAGLQVVEKDEQVLVTAPAVDQPAVERVVHLLRRGMQADDWLQILGGGRMKVAREAVFEWDNAEYRQCLADIAARSGVAIVLDEHALLGGKQTLPKVSLKLGRTAPEKALTQLVEQQGQTALLTLEYLARGEVYLVTTKHQVRLPMAAFTVSRQSLAKAKVERMDMLVDHITKTIDNASWAKPQAEPTTAPASGPAAPPPPPAAGGLAAVPAPQGRILLVGNKLLCRQSPKNLAAIGELLDDPMYEAVSKRLATMAATAAKVSGGTKTPKTGTPSAGAKDEPRTPAPRLPLAATQPDSGPGKRLKLADVYIQQGLTEKARTLLQEIIAKYPDSDEAGKAKKKLEQLKEE